MATHTITQITLPNGDVVQLKDNVSNYITSASLPQAATATPQMDGTAAVGNSAKYARENHVHPTDTTRASATALEALSQRVDNIEIAGGGEVNIITGIKMRNANENLSPDSNRTVTIPTLDFSVDSTTNNLTISWVTSTSNQT